MDLPPRPAKPIRIYGFTGENGPVVVEYHHIDGMYSYCMAYTPEGEELGHAHLSVSTPLKQYKDGFKLVEEPEETDSGRDQENSGDSAN